MQIIQGIRDKGAAIVIVVISLSLIGFILMDAKQGGNNMSAASGSIGKVNGNSIEKDEFDKKWNLLEKQEEQQSGQRPTSTRSAQIREQVWNQIVAESVFYAEASKLGIEFTSKELDNILKSDDPSNPLMQDRSMIDPATGKLDRAKLGQALTNIKKMKGEEWDVINAQIIEPQKLTSVSTKYFALLNASAYYPAWMEEKDAKENKSFATVSYVQIPYQTINDSTIKVTDAEIEKYVQNRKDLFKQEAGRMISYIGFSQLPSAADSAKTKVVIESLKTDFTNEPNAKTFLARNASAEPFNEDFVWKSKLELNYKDSILALQKGQVFGPYLDGNGYKLAKMVDVKQLPDSVRCRHILIKIADLKEGQIANNIRPDTTARTLVDSIAAAIAGGADFNSMVLKYSDDPGSKGTGGAYSFNYNNTLVDSFYRTVFYEPVGTKKVVLGIDQNGYVGYHYIEVLNQYNFEPAYKVGILAKEIFASEETINKASNDAIKLSAEKDPKKMEDYIQKNGLQKISLPTLIKENDAQVGQLQDARQLVRWVFEAKKGDVSDPMPVGDQFVVAMVDKIYKEGTQDVETARPLAENAIREEKKAAEIIKALGTNPTLESASAKYTTEILTAGTDSSITFKSQIINTIGNEPKLIGAMFNKANLNKVAAPVAGKAGVYVFKVNSIGEKTTDPLEDKVQTRAQQTAALRNQAVTNWFEGLRKKATIKDERSKFF